ncbi:MAG TPA: tRNA pseudouridine(55) synthase TruB, partial [Anaerolineae bacterium]
NTDDADGEVIATGDPANVTESQLRDILLTFVGEIQQTPPIFSALKKNGQPLYKRARAGQPVEVSPRAVTIHALTWVDWEPPDLILDVVCSPGTYIRALARDLGQASGVPAHLAALTRTASGDWLLEQAVSLTRLEMEAAEGSDRWQRHLLPPDRTISHLPRVTLDQAGVIQVKHGQQVQVSNIEAGPDETVSDTLVRAYTPAGEFLAILTQVNADDKLWQPKKVFQTR